MKIERGKQLPDADEEAVRGEILSELESDPERYLGTYARLFGNVLNADNAATLFPIYNENPARYRVAVHPAAQWIRDELFRRALAKKGRDRDRVVFTAGGNAVGKSLAISFSGASNHSTAAVFDSTFSDPAHSVRLVGQAAGAGKRVAILFVYRPVAETLMAMLDRAGAEGRVVTLDQLIRSRRGAAETVRMLWDRFGNRSDFAFHFFDNSPGGFKESGVELTKPGAYTEERESLDGILDAEHRSTRISEAVYRRVKGRRESPLCGD